MASVAATNDPPPPPSDTLAALRPPTAVETECPPTDMAGLECLTVTVPIDPEEPSGPTIDLAVTTLRADSSSWTSPVLRIGIDYFAFPFDSVLPESGRHDLIWVDHRGFGRSAPYPACDPQGTHAAELNTIRISAEFGAELKECVQAAINAEVPLASALDQHATAADLSAVRQALGIDRWSLYAESFGFDIALRLLALEPETITSIMSVGAGTVGNNATVAKADEAFAAFAADCAAAPGCSQKGDLHVLLDGIVNRFAPGIVTATPDPGTGGFVTLDVPSGLNGIIFAMNTADLAPVLPGLLEGLVDGTADDAVAGFFASTPADSSPVALANNCQQQGYYRPPMAAWGSTADGRFGAMTWQPLCDAIGTVPQHTPTPVVTSEVPVLIVLSAYRPDFTLDSTREALTGLTNMHIVQSPGVSQLTKQLPECLAATFVAFFDAPDAAIDTTCLTSPATKSLS